MGIGAACDGRLFGQQCVQQQAGLGPVAPHGTFGHVQGFADLGVGHAGEIAHLDHLGQPRLGAGQHFQGCVHFQARAGVFQIVGEVGIVLPGPRSASVVAKTDCEFVAVDEKRFQFLVQQTPFFATQVMRVMAERLRKVNQLLAATSEA